MDLTAELEKMAANALAKPELSDDDELDDILGYAPPEASRRSKPAVVTTQFLTNDDSKYLVKLEGPLNSPEQIRQLADLSEAPQRYDGKSEETDNEAVFCRINGNTKQAILDWLAKGPSSFRPLFISQSIARKNLSCYSQAPTLGCDSTMPQYRLTSPSEVPLPRQSEYPVWYFFYGTLEDSATLARILEHLDRPDSTYSFKPAAVQGGVVKTWGNGKYRALVDGPVDAQVTGSAFLVVSKEYEDALRYFETKAYEVVRCTIMMEDDCKYAVQGCTFRFVGTVDA